jgi:REP element-mobilizing transposase RayT
MYLYTIRAARGTLLFRTWGEARVLWEILARIPGIVALVLMPDHVHLLVMERGLPHVQGALRAWALRRNHMRGEEGQVWGYRAKPREIQDDKHARRAQRYIHLNPCRGELAGDPLEWAFSTHRDAVGLAWPAVRRVSADPGRLHAFVSSDPTVHPDGTRLPDAPVMRITEDGWEFDEVNAKGASLSQVAAAVSAVTRAPAAMLKQRGKERTLFLRSARALTQMPGARIARAVGVKPATVSRAGSKVDARVRIVRRVLGDARFGLLGDGDLRELERWSAYRDRD